MSDFEASISLLRDIHDGLVAMTNEGAAIRYITEHDIKTSVPLSRLGVCREVLRKALIHDIERFLDEQQTQTAR
jgi:hypothetical protein